MLNKLIDQLTYLKLFTFLSKYTTISKHYYRISISQHKHSHAAVESNGPLHRLASRLSSLGNLSCHFPSYRVHSVCTSSSWSTLQSLSSLNTPHQASPIVTMPGHGDILVGEAARAMCCPVDIDGPDPLCTQVSVCNSISLFSRALTTVRVGWCFLTALSEAIRLTKDCTRLTNRLHSIRNAKSTHHSLEVTLEMECLGNPHPIIIQCPPCLLQCCRVRPELLRVLAFRKARCG